MKKVYICSPYRAKDGAELDRNIDYAQHMYDAKSRNLTGRQPVLTLDKSINEPTER